MGSVLCRTNSDELTDQAAGIVYHCGSACAALANHSVTPILYPDQFHRRLHLPPLVAWPFPSSPTLQSLRNYKHSFHTKSGQRSPTVRNESRASRIFATDYHPFALTFSPLPQPPTTVRFTMVHWISFPNFRDYRVSRSVASENIRTYTHTRDAHTCSNWRKNFNKGLKK